MVGSSLRSSRSCCGVRCCRGYGVDNTTTLAMVEEDYRRPVDQFILLVVVVIVSGVSGVCGNAGAVHTSGESSDVRGGVLGVGCGCSWCQEGRSCPHIR